MTPWFEIYRERMNQRYLDHVASKYAPFIENLFGIRGFNFTEIGCGAGNITRILREMHGAHGNSRVYGYHLIDACPKMLSLAIENNPQDNCIFQCGDVKNATIPESNLVYSHGLLEHFDDFDIRGIVHRMKYVAATQVHYVPSALYEAPSRGDERLMEPDQWREILSGLGRVTITPFNNGLDLILRIER